MAHLGHAVTALGRNLAVGQNLQAAGIRFAQVDLLDQSQLIQATRGADFVFHCAAQASPWGAYTTFHHVNVVGTQNVIDACKIARVNRLIHVSTPSIYFNGKSQFQTSESAELPQKFANPYAETKHQAELLIDQAYAEGLPVVTIRPRAIIGPHDTAIMPRVLRVLKKGWFPVFSGDACWVDLTCVENVVDALVLCMEAGPEVEGKKYNITNGEPLKIRDLVQTMAQHLGLQPRMIRIPYSLAYGLASLLESLAGNKEPLFTRYSLGLLGRSQTLDISAAKRELRYTPGKSIHQGLQDYAIWWKTERNDRIGI
jgi:nucleoside-diphosphate-sugar epimerase